MQLYNHRSPQLLQTSIQHQTPACIQLPCKASTFLWFTSYSHPCPAHILRAFHQRIFPDGTFPQDFSATLHKQTFTQKSTLFDAFIHNLASTLLVHFFHSRPFPSHIFAHFPSTDFSTHYVPLTLLTHFSLTPFSLTYPLVDAYLKDAIPLETFF